MMLVSPMLVVVALLDNTGHQDIPVHKWNRIILMCGNFELEDERTTVMMNKIGRKLD